MVRMKQRQQSVSAASVDGLHRISRLTVVIAYLWELPRILIVILVWEAIMHNATCTVDSHLLNIERMWVHMTSLAGSTGGCAAAW